MTPSPPETLSERSFQHIVPPEYYENIGINSLRRQYIVLHKLQNFGVPAVDATSDILNAMTYGDSADQPLLPMIVNSYNVLIEHLLLQFEMLKSVGYRFHSKSTEYHSGEEILLDLHERGLLCYVPDVITENSHEEDQVQDQGPLSFKQLVEAVNSDNEPMTAAEVFTCVHRSLAQSAGYDVFSFNGKKGAWLVHRQCLPEEAHLALWNQTRGRDAWDHAGPHMRTPDGAGFYRLLTEADNEYISPAQRPITLQKSVIAPYAFV